MAKVKYSLRIMKDTSVAIILFVLALLSASATHAAETYITTADVDVYDEPNGNIIATWPSHTLFTSNKKDTVWIRVSGHFPEGEWQSIFPMWYVKADSQLELKKARTVNAPATTFYSELPKVKRKAKAFRLLESTDVLNANGEKIAHWQAGFTFTSAYQNDSQIKVTGTFPDGAWQRLEQPVWLNKPVRLQDRSQPTMFPRDKNTKRLVVIDKQAFSLTLFEIDDQVTPILTSPVALGYDRCLPAAQGGKCYYTPEGEYEIEFKLFETDGIKWCIPKKMEAEFADKIAKGQRCWRGIMGNHALHFGNSLFLHGTSNPGSIGSKTTHGCVRMRNQDIELVYRLLQEGDKVLITSDYDSMVAQLYAEQDEALALDQLNLDVTSGSNVAVGN